MGQKRDEKLVPLADIYVQDEEDERVTSTSAACQDDGLSQRRGERSQRRLADTPMHGGSGDSMAALVTSSSKSRLLRKSVILSVPLPAVVYRPAYVPAKREDVAVTGHFLGHVVSRAAQGGHHLRGQDAERKARVTRACGGGPLEDIFYGVTERKRELSVPHSIHCTSLHSCQAVGPSSST